jgi:hypothetical protein
MPRISTIKSNKILRREYRLRFITAFLMGIALAILISIIFILPSYTLLSFYEKSYEKSSTSEEQLTNQKMNQEYLQKLDGVHELSQKIDTNSVNHLKVIQKLSEYAANSVTFNVVELSSTGEGLDITLRGQAVSREALLSFEDKIDSDTNFTGFDIPIETLTKPTNISFNIIFTYHEK